MKKPLRSNTKDYKKLGGTKKKLRWRRPKGRHNKIREKIRGKVKMPAIGMKKPRVERKEVLVRNLRDIEKVKKSEPVLIARVGKRKRKLIQEKAKEKGLKILNIKTIK